MSETNLTLLQNVNILIDDLDKKIQEKQQKGKLLIETMKDRIKNNPDYLFLMDEKKYNVLLDTKDKNQETVIEIMKDINKITEKLEKIKMDIIEYTEINDKLGSIINNQRIGSLLQHSVHASEKFIKDNKIKKIRKTIFPRLLKTSKFTIKESKKSIGGSLKKKSRKNLHEKK
jgi:hypothetical protein